MRLRTFFILNDPVYLEIAAQYSGVTIIFQEYY